MSESVRTALVVAYLGGDFAGWQEQTAARTVQGEIQRALATLTGTKVTVTAAGRTDAGVHATGQVAHCDVPRSIPPPGLAAALNGLLPPDVRVVRARRVAPAFHARRDAVAKRYRYRLATVAIVEPWEALRTWAVPYRLDVRAMERSAAALAGTHDFAAFALSGHSGTGRRGCERTIRRLDLVCRGRRLGIVVEGDGFLRGMVRRLAGALVEVGRGAQPPSWIAALLAGRATRPPAPTAPAHGLTLERVFYGNR